MADNRKQALIAASSNAAKEAKRSATRNAKRIAKRALRESYLDVIYPRIYRLACSEPVDPRKVIMLSDKLEVMPDSFSVIYDRLTTEFDVDVTFIGLGSARTGFRPYHERCRAAVAEMATAAVIFVDDASSVVSCLPLRSETRVIQLWHACGAFKKWGLSTAELKFGESRRNQLRHPYYLNLDLVTVSSPEVEWAYREAMNLNDTPDVVQPLGVSRTDRYFDPSFVDSARERIRNEFPNIGDRKIILYAPTFRGTVKGAKGPDYLDLAAMKNALADRYILLIRHHPFVKAVPPIPTEARDFAFHAETLPGDELMAAADLLVTDYSSVVFEFSLFDRPMAFLAPDINEYDDWRGFYYPYEEMTPGPILQNTEDFVSFVNQAEHNSSYTAIVAAFRRRFMRSCDGHATDRILERTFGERLEELRKPSASEAIRSEAKDGIDISIIVPAFNAMPELTRTLQSIAVQTADHSCMEAIVVDDGSTDGTWGEIQRFAADYPGLFVPVKLDKASGSPARPRNEALARARGAYVLCLDADDFIGPEAVEKMLEHAYEWGSDVLYVKMVSEGGRKVPQSMFDRNQPRVDIIGSKILWSIGPTKLFRRALLQENGIQFLEGGMPEDLHVTVPAICAAKTTSVAADYDYYHCGWRESANEGAVENTSTGIWRDFENNMRSYEPLMHHITQQWAPKERRDVLMRRLFGLDVMNLVEGLVDKPADEQSHRITKIREVFGGEYVPETYNRMPLNQRVALDTLFLGDPADIAAAWQSHESAMQKTTGTVEESHILANVDPLAAPIDITDAVHAQHMQTRLYITKSGVLRLEGQTTLTSLPTSLLDQGSMEVIFRGRGGRTLSTTKCKIAQTDEPQPDSTIELKWSCEQPIRDLISSAHSDEMWGKEPIPCTIKPVFRIGEIELGALVRRQRLANDNIYWEWLQSPLFNTTDSMVEATVAEEGKIVLSLNKKEASNVILSEARSAESKDPMVYTAEPQIIYQADEQPTTTPKVSVLTPIYNVELYLAECLESLKAQTLKDIEFICINDGSTDNSRAILEAMTAGDPRFVIVDKANSGYGKSMNFGLSIARGEYIGILESDDYADPDYFEVMYELAVANDKPDIVKSNHCRLLSNGADKHFENYPETICNKILKPSDPEYTQLITSTPAIWAAIYRHEFLETTGIGFLETPGAAYQDTGFVMKTWIAASAAYVDHEAHMHYRTLNEGSSSKSRDKHLAILGEYASIDEFLAARPTHYEALAPAVQAKRLDAYWWNLKRIHPSLRQEFATEAQAGLIAIDQLELWDRAPLSDAERKRLAIWMQDPDLLLLDLAISEARKSKSLAQYPLRLRRKMARTR